MKGDAFGQMTRRPDGWTETQSMQSIEDWAAALLRRHHARIRREVLSQRHAWQVGARACVKEGGNSLCWDMRVEACNDVLEGLTRMQKGK